MNITFNKLTCDQYGKDLKICAGDVVQILQECLDELECNCPCGAVNLVYIESAKFKIKNNSNEK